MLSELRQKQAISLRQDTYPEQRTAGCVRPEVYLLQFSSTEDGQNNYRYKKNTPYLDRSPIRHFKDVMSLNISKIYFIRIDMPREIGADTMACRCID